MMQVGKTVASTISFRVNKELLLHYFEVVVSVNVSRGIVFPSGRYSFNDLGETIFHNVFGMGKIEIFEIPSSSNYGSVYRVVLPNPIKCELNKENKFRLVLNASRGVYNQMFENKKASNGVVEFSFENRINFVKELGFKMV